jgi:hypothetical protein
MWYFGQTESEGNMEWISHHMDQGLYVRSIYIGISVNRLTVHLLISYRIRGEE